MIHDIDLLSLGFRIRLITDSHDAVRYFQNTGERQIPAYSWCEARRRIHPHATITYLDVPLQEVAIDPDGNTAFIATSWNTLFESDLEFLALMMFNRLYLQRGWTCANSVGLKKGDSGILLLGEYGSGKSIVGLSLTKHGYKLISGDRTVVGTTINSTPYILGGTVPLRLRAGTIQKFFPELIQCLPTTLKSYDDFWEKQFTIHTSSQRFVIQQNAKAPLKSLFFVRVMPSTESEESYRSLGRPFDRIRLYLALSYYILGHGIVFMGVGKPLPSVDNVSFAKSRIDLAKKMLESAHCFEIKGNLNFVLDRIVTLAEGGLEEDRQLPEDKKS